MQNSSQFPETGYSKENFKKHIYTRAHAYTNLTNTNTFSAPFSSQVFSATKQPFSKKKKWIQRELGPSNEKLKNGIFQSIYFRTFPQQPNTP